MRIFVESITLDQPIHTMEVSVPDPEWRWTAANGVEFYVESGGIEPGDEIEMRVLDHGCGNPECWHGECWREEIPHVRGTGERIDPPMVKQTISRPIHTRIFGKGRVEGSAEDLAQAIDWPGCWSLDDQGVERGPDVLGMRGQFSIVKIGLLRDGVAAAHFEFQSVHKVEG